MAKNARSAKSGKAAQSAAGRVLRDPKGSARSSKVLSTAELSQIPGEASPQSRRVIKDVSNEHREALKRLVER
jgi:gas vesicle protein